MRVPQNTRPASLPWKHSGRMERTPACGKVSTGCLDGLWEWMVDSMAGYDILEVVAGFAEDDNSLELIICVVVEPISECLDETDSLAGKC